MAYKVRCPACAKGVAVADGDIGRVVFCQACGHRFEAPPPVLLEPLAPGERLTPPQPPQLRPPPPAGDETVVPAYQEPARAEALAVSPARHGAHPLWWLLAGVLLCGGAGLAILAGFGRFESWESQNRAAIVALKARAESRGAAGRFQEAHEAYGELEALIGGRLLRDAGLRTLADDARADHRRIYASLLARMVEQAKVRATAPTPDVAAAAPGPVPTSRPAPRPPSPIATQAAAPAAPPPPAATAPTSRSSPADVATHVDRSDTRPTTDPAVARATTRPEQARQPRPAPQPLAPPRNLLTDEQIGRAIQRGADFLLSQFDPKEGVLRHRGGEGDDAYFAGKDALAVYALLQSGVAIGDPRLKITGPTMQPLVDAVKRLPMNGHKQTYARGLRATCLALFNRPVDFGTMKDDADFLMGTCDDGGYTYAGPYRTLRERTASKFGKINGDWDNSNSQYGVLGVWSATDADPRVEVPSEYWKAVQRHWEKCQGENGQWSYRSVGRDSGTLTMTSAGIASLFVAHEYLQPPMVSSQIGRPPFTPALRKALDWYERGDNIQQEMSATWWAYSMYGIERVGLATGFKHFGKHDWYRELAAKIVAAQSDGGYWTSDRVVDTSFALLFLARGRHPVLMNKLRFDRNGPGTDLEVGVTPGGYWANRPRDAANLARFAGRQLERPINWQVVNVDNPWHDWTDSPVLYVASHEPPGFTERDVEKIRQFVRAGGILFTHADAGSPSFDTWARDLAQRLWPEYPLGDLPAEHPLFNILFRPNPRPVIKVVSNGSRLLMVHSPQDIATRWQNREDRAFEGRSIAEARAPAIRRYTTRPVPEPERKEVEFDPEIKARRLAPFHFGVNLFVYAAGKRDLRNRIDSTYVAAVSDSVKPIGEPVTIVRLRYAGNWDPEPGAWDRYANWFRRATGMKLEVDTVRLADLKPSAAGIYPVAHLTGTDRQAFTADESKALREYVEAGGVVLIDPTGGSTAFDQSAREVLLRDAFPATFAQIIGSEHPLLTASAPGMEDLARPRVRAFTSERLGRNVGAVSVLPAGKGHVIFTSLDVTSGLLGTNTWGILGYEPAYAQSLLKNAILWALDGQPKAAGP